MKEQESSWARALGKQAPRKQAETPDERGRD
jgi:hypothetical protein